MNKEIAIKVAKRAGLGALLLVALFLFTLPKGSKILGGDKEVAKMTRTGDAYEVTVLTEDADRQYQATKFKVDARVIDSLGFTEAEVKSACSAGADRARKYVETFVYKETPELKVVGGKPTIVMSVTIDPKVGNDMFISGEVTKGGQALPMMATIEDPS